MENLLTKDALNIIERKPETTYPDGMHHALVARKQTLEDIARVLKDRFIGLDNVIDEVIALMMPWHLFPEAQLRPTIINLWGLTGSGKTALVRNIVELLDYSKLYTHFDMGEFESGSSSWMKNVLTDDLEFFHKKPAIICLDEFQFAKTLESGKELRRDKLRVVWELLDSGKVNYIPRNNTYYLIRAESCVTRLQRAMQLGVTLKEGEVDAEMEVFNELFDSFYFEDQNRNGVALDKRYFLSSDFVEGMYWLFEKNDFSQDAIRKRVQSSCIQGLMDFLIEGMKTRMATRTLDLSRSLIFILGNLDEAYHMSRSLNPDISADDLHAATARITLADIKGALSKRFRSEQVARLGNNHVIYQSFTKSNFRKLIERELKRISDFVAGRFGWRITFDASVLDILYAEGVFPSQGTRPVFTTVKNLIESRIGKIAIDIIERKLSAVDIYWSFEDDCFSYKVTAKGGEEIYTFNEKINFKVESLRKTTNPQIQAHTAVHESGHAILAALTFRIIPSVVVSKAASDSAVGFCWINFPEGPVTKDSLLKDIIITLGGYVAEKLIFGDTYTSAGVKSDIIEASELANRAIRKFAMGSDPIRIAVENRDNEDLFFHSARYSEEALQIIRHCQLQAEQILTRNKLLLLKMANYLTNHARMEEHEIRLCVRQYSVEPWVATEGFLKKEHYYQFHQNVLDQLEQLESDSKISPFQKSDTITLPRVLT